MTTQTLATAEIGKWLRIWVRFSQIFDSGSGSGSERKTQHPAEVNSGTPDPKPPLGPSPNSYCKYFACCLLLATCCSCRMLAVVRNDLICRLLCCVKNNTFWYRLEYRSDVHQMLWWCVHETQYVQKKWFFKTEAVTRLLIGVI